MAIIITEECINCGACEPECPNNAIYDAGAAWKFSEGTNLKGLIDFGDGHNIDADLAQNAVLGLVYNGKTVQKGFAIRKGATLDLLVGDGYGNVKVDIPNLTGLNFEEAQFVLNASKLRLGTIIFEGNSTDTFNTKIYKQSPAFSTDTAINKIGQGSAIDIYVKED